MNMIALGLGLWPPQGCYFLGNPKYLVEERDEDMPARWHHSKLTWFCSLNAHQCVETKPQPVLLSPMGQCGDSQVLLGGPMDRSPLTLSRRAVILLSLP